MSNHDLIGDITPSKTPATDKIVQVKGVADKIRALIAAEKVPLARNADIVPPSKPVLIAKPASVANAPTPKLTKAVAMPPTSKIATQPIAGGNWKTRAAARAKARAARQ